jgi:hypothetical protein
MIQNFIAYLVLIIAFSALILNIFRFFNIIGKKPMRSSSCAGCSTGCEINEVHQYKKHQAKRYDQFKMQL